MSTRDRIVEAAMGLFVRHGYRLTSMEQVGREAGLTRQALYHHFRTKEALFRAVVESVEEGALELAADAGMEQERRNAGLADVLIAQITARWRYFSDRTQGSPYVDELLSEHQRQSQDIHQIFAEKEFRLIVETIERRVGRGAALADAATPEDLARCIQLAARGAKADMAGENGAVNLERTVRLLVQGALAPSTASRNSTGPEAVP